MQCYNANMKQWSESSFILPCDIPEIPLICRGCIIGCEEFDEVDREVMDFSSMGVAL
jgi:hypothetical protein